ncbi:MAG: hypothetical protein M1818_001496 [Claussenomyces sp. TS43310]|nr:MAG: hypothetical protein M1818_001496 [Claussenomyces sp. TS43310]
MSFEVLQERLSALQETTAQIQELISRLANLKFQPGSIPLDSEEGNIGNELGAEIQGGFKEQAEDLELLEQEVRDLPPGREGTQRAQDKSLLVGALTRATQALKSARVSFRQAQITAKFNLEEAQRMERALLLSSLVDAASSPDSSASFQPVSSRRQKSSPLSKGDKLLNASSDVTLALRRTHDLMASELSRSQFAHDTLRESTAALSELSESYGVLDTMLSRSRTLLGTLLKSQKSDTWYLETAFFVLVATIGWLIFRRFIYGPAWWLIYLPLMTLYKAWMGVFVAVGLRSNRDGIFATNNVETTELMPTAIPRVTVLGSEAPSMSVGDEPATSQAAGEEGNMMDEVGRIIDGARGDNQTGGESSGDADDGLGEKDEEGIQRNPKKRMWEEDKEAKKEEQRRKDEL